MIMSDKVGYVCVGVVEVLGCFIFGELVIEMDSQCGEVYFDDCCQYVSLKFVDFFVSYCFFFVYSFCIVVSYQLRILVFCWQ